MLELAHTLDAIPQRSPLGDVQEKRDLSIKQVAYRTLGGAEGRWAARRRGWLPRQLADAALVAAAVAALLSALAVMFFAPNLKLTQTRTVEAIPNANLAVEAAGLDRELQRQHRLDAPGAEPCRRDGLYDRARRQGRPVQISPLGRLLRRGGRDTGLRLARQLGVTTERASGQLLIVVGPKTVSVSG